MPVIEKDLGFVLRRRNFRETSLIAEIYTARFGKIAGILKGFYTQKKEFSSPLETFSLNEFVFYPKRSEIWLVSFVDLLRDYRFLNKNLSKARAAAACFNLINRTVSLWDKNLPLFRLTEDFLDGIREDNEEKMLCLFLIKFLTISGFKPQIDRCIVCGEKFHKDLFFSVSRGGLVCDKCGSGEKDSRRMSREAASSFLYVQNNDFLLSRRLMLSVPCKKEILSILRDFLAYHLEFDALAGFNMAIAGN